MTLLKSVLSQIGYPGAGDIDDCWCVATIMAMHAVAPNNHLPTVPQFRAAAGVPDVQGRSDGGNVNDIMKACNKLWPTLHGALSSRAWASFASAVKGGKVASLSLLSGNLPSRYRFGFSGTHQVYVEYTGGAWYIANPLAKTGSALQAISEADLKRAAVTLPGLGGQVLAVLFPRPVVVVPPVHQWSMLIEKGTVAKLATIRLGKILRWTDYRWQGNDSSAPCDPPQELKGIFSGSATVVHVTAGVFANKYLRVGNGVTAK
jgi:hypothetical protein